MKLYHYTSVETLLTMLDKSIKEDESVNVKYLELWAFPTSDMEDKSEYSLFTDKVKEEVRKFALSDNRTLRDKELEKLDKLCRCNLYTISLTDRKDSSYMWEVYGDNHTGVCIEFDFCFGDRPPYYGRKDGCLLMEMAYDSMLKRCKYIHPEELTIEENLISDIYQYVINEANTSSEVIKGASILSRLENRAIVYKRQEFSQESELRFVLGSICDEEHLQLPIATYLITSIILGSSIKKEAKDCATQRVLEVLGPSIDIYTSELLQ